MTVINLQVAASADDAWQSGSGTPNLTATTLELGNDSNNVVAIARFLNVTVPQGSTINQSLFTVKCTTTYPGPAGLIVYAQAEAADNSAQPTTAANNIASRALTPTPTSWDIHTMTAETDYTVDVTSHVQAVINRPGWVSGNAISIIITNNTAPANEWQDVYSYDNTPAKAPKLSIDYGAGGSVAAYIDRHATDGIDCSIARGIS